MDEHSGTCLATLQLTQVVQLAFLVGRILLNVKRWLYMLESTVEYPRTLATHLVFYIACKNRSWKWEMSANSPSDMYVHSNDELKWNEIICLSIHYSRRTPFDLGVFHGNVITTRAFLQHDPSLALTDAGTSALHRAIAGHAANACVLANVVVSRARA
jgi:hypothetical protein